MSELINQLLRHSGSTVKFPQGSLQFTNTLKKKQTFGHIFISFNVVNTDM